MKERVKTSDGGSTCRAGENMDERDSRMKSNPKFGETGINWVNLGSQTAHHLWENHLRKMYNAERGEGEQREERRIITNYGQQFSETLPIVN